MILLINTKMELLCATILLLFTSAIAQDSTTGSIPNYSLSTYQSVQSISDWDNYFVTVTISNIEDCIRLCNFVSSCIFVNYQVSSHVCNMSNVLEYAKYTTESSKTPGYVSWIRIGLSARSLPVNLLTSSGQLDPCNNGQSCYSDGTTESRVYACGRPPLSLPYNVTGNVYTVDAKLWHSTCINHVNDVNKRSLRCLDDGQWDGIQHTCNYTTYTPSNGSSFAIKIVDDTVNQSTAISRCKMDGANLTTVLTKRKLELFQGIFANRSIQGNYWVDTMRVSGNTWRTSHDVTQPMGDDLWYDFTRTYNDDCARMREYRGYLLDDYYCGGRFGYVCEIQL